MTIDKLKIILAGSGYLSNYIIKLAGQFEHQSITEYSRTEKNNKYTQYIHKDFDDNSCHLDEVTDSSSIIYMAPPRQDRDGDIRLGNFLEKLSKRKIHKITYISTSGVYGDYNGGLVDETSKLQPITERANRRLAAENMIQEYSSVSSNAYIILRVPGIYGPGRLPIDRIRKQEPILRESESKKTNLIHVEDLARISWLCLTSNIENEIFNVSDGSPITVTYFYKEICKIVGLKMPPEISMGEANECFSEKRLSFLKESRILDISKMRKFFPGQIKYENIIEGIKKSL